MDRLREIEKQLEEASYLILKIGGHAAVFVVAAMLLALVILGAWYLVKTHIK